MPVVEAVTIELGLAIAKSILKLWLKDTPVISDVSSNILDILKSKTSDKVAQWKAQHQFEAIGVKVGESLLPFFEIEDKQLDESSRTAVALAVADTLENAQISSKLLVKGNLEPTRLTKHVLDAYPSATKGFNETEITLYKRIIKESCECIVDIASQLPNFTERTFAEILRREDQLLTITSTVLEELRQMRENLNPLVEAERFELEYRRAVARNMDTLQLYGTNVSPANRRHRLSVAYVTLSVEQKGPETSDKNYFSLEKQQDKSTRDVLVSVDQTLANSRRLLILGLAGSGKTTLLQWIAVRSASRSFEGQLLDWNKTLPFYIRLRHCIKSGLPAPEDFPKLIAPAIAASMPAKWVHTQLKAGHAVVLVDGLDEVPALERENVRIWLKELVETFPKTRFVVTSRPHAIEEGWMDHEGFDHAELQPMGISDINSFINHWHAAVQEELQEDTEKAELPLLVEHLKGVVKSSRSIRNMATNPLLCAMLCALNRDRRKQLPADRIELYEACCQLLIERRDTERHIDLADYPSLTYRQKRVLLEDLAYWLVKNGWSEVKQQQVANRFAKKLTNMQNTSSDISGDHVCKFFVERSGILREPITGSVDFTHRTFQEFLAAQAALDEEDIGLLIQNAHNDQWREVIILASGLASKKVRETLLQKLIERGNKEKIYRYQLHLLAVSCFETSVELGQNIKAEMEKRLSKLVPPKSAIDANALASAGELAVPYLSNSDLYSDSTKKMCIHTLALIGSDAALDILEGYALNPSPLIIDQLLEMWDSFDRKIYARRILAQALKNISSIQLKKIPSLEGCQYFNNLTTLNLLECEEVVDLGPLASLTQLHSLTLTGCMEVSDLSPLASLTQLTSLSLADCEEVDDLSPLASLTQLTSLSLADCEEVDDLSPLAYLTRLNSLSLTFCKMFSDLSPLTTLTHLTSLDLSSCPKLNNLLPLANLTNLAFLDLSFCSKISDLSPLTSLTQLTSLNISFCEQIRDLGPLTSLTQLTSLDLSNCQYMIDLSLLASLTQLTSLNISNCGHVTDLSPLASLIRLTSLNISYYRQIRELDPLTSLTQLTSLSISDCGRVTDLSPLAPLTRLTSLDLSNCERIEDLSPLASLTRLTYLDLSNCERIEDLSPLASLTRLTYLDLSHCEEIDDLSPLASLTRLTYLDLSHCERIFDLSDLDGLKNLKTLKLDEISQHVNVTKGLEKYTRRLNSVEDDEE